jgi:DNA polymerase III epsilon subunit-like protein
MGENPRPDALAQPWTAQRYVVVDVEGNGQHPPDLAEVAVVPVDAGQVGPVTSWLIRPPRPVTWQARRVHGLTDTDLADAPAVDDVAQDIAARLSHGVVVGHNVGVDVAVLTRSLPGWQPGPVIDTLRLARNLMPELQTHRLTALVEHLGLTTYLPGSGPHRAGYDALAAAHLFTRLAAHEASEPRTLRDLLDRATVATRTGQPDSLGAEEQKLF